MEEHEPEQAKDTPDTERVQELLAHSADTNSDLMAEYIAESIMDDIQAVMDDQGISYEAMAHRAGWKVEDVEKAMNEVPENLSIQEFAELAVAVGLVLRFYTEPIEEVGHKELTDEESSRMRIVRDNLGVRE